MDFNNVKKFMNRLTDWIIPGNTIVIYKDNKKIFEYSSGFSDVEKHVKMNGSELLNIYSCSKVATVVAALQLHEKGLFTMFEPLYDILPEFKDMCVKASDGGVVEINKPIKIGQLFTMTAGFNYSTRAAWRTEAEKLTDGKMNTLDVIKCLAANPLDFQPDEHWQYSLCHDVLAAVVERLSGMKFRDYVSKNVFEPLEMNNSLYHNTAVQDRMAEMYRFKTEESDVVKLQANSSSVGTLVNVGKDVDLVFGEEYDSGGAGITTSVSDYAKLAAALANNGLGFTGERILSKASIDLMKTNHLNQEQMKDFCWSHLKGYGYGLGVRTMHDKALAGSLSPIGEFGWGGAAGATILVDTQNNLSFFYAHHMLNCQESFYQPRLRNVLYSCL